MKPQLAILDEDPYLADPALLAPVAVDYTIHSWPDARHWPATELAARLRTVDVAITGRKSPRIPDELADAPGQLRYLLHLHGTVRPYVKRRHIERGLTVTNWGDNVAYVAEGALALLLASLKQLPGTHRYSLTNSDPRIYHAFPSTLHGTHVGLYGFGPIGQHMARFLAPLGAHVAIYDPFARDVPPTIRVCSSLRELFATCPIISIHCGLNPATRDSVTAELLQLLPQGGILINTARGEIVDEAALARLCAQGRLLAGVDVIRDERNWPASPLASSDNAILSRHVVASGKGVAPQLRGPPRLPDFALANLHAFATGRPLINTISVEEFDRKT